MNSPKMGTVKHKIAVQQRESICGLHNCFNPSISRQGYCKRHTTYLERCEKTIRPYRKLMRHFTGTLSSISSIETMENRKRKEAA